MTRLLKSATKGDRTIKVEAGLDFVPGDKLALMPTSYRADKFDSLVIDTYNSTSGDVTFKKALKFYHYGKENSTAEDYNGVDMRGEVVLLSRNILIQGTETDGWGCQIVTSDTEEFDTEENVIKRIGQTILHNVEVFQCSQQDTVNAAIRFHNL